MGGYITHELAELLGGLTAQQRQAIARIVAHHYVENLPLAHLFQGEDKICSEALYYRRGKVDPATGQARGVGWSHQPAFVEALRMAARLALQARVGEETHAVREAVRRARLAASSIVGTLASDAVFSEAPVDRTRAGKVLLDIALKNTEFGERPSDGDLADDWWKAAEE